MEDCEGVKGMKHNFQVTGNIPLTVPYRQLIGRLTHIAVISRPDMMFSVLFLSRFIDKPTQQIWIATEHVLRYLYQTSSLNLTYNQKSSDEGMIAYSDADYTTDVTNRKSVSVSAIFYKGGSVFWQLCCHIYLRIIVSSGITHSFRSC
ncbi:hypothetical protein JTB14_026078 [Gonioctena quinquepunctata]|nr:hypothetical protein JTB14_026078 [Gonioctena quinquepunctata]